MDLLPLRLHPGLGASYDDGNGMSSAYAVKKNHPHYPNRTTKAKALVRTDRQRQASGGWTRERPPEPHFSEGSTMSNLQHLEAALVIDENALEDALQAQPEAFYRVSKALAFAMSRRDAAKKTLEEVEATVDLNHRAIAAANDQKVTERALESMRILHSDVKIARDGYIAFEHKFNKLRALKDSFEQRSWALNKLVDLYIHNYYGETSHRVVDDTVKNLKSRQAREGIKKELRRERM
jgi:hypothetical protein